jgi:hypothetical protein
MQPLEHNRIGTDADQSGLLAPDISGMKFYCAGPH